MDSILSFLKFVVYLAAIILLLGIGAYLQGSFYEWLRRIKIRKMKNSIVNLTLVLIVGLFVVLGCSSANTNSTPSTATPASSNAAKSTAPVAADEKPIAVQAKVLTQEYDENELAADGKYKDKMLAVSGKISNIAETLGKLTVQLEGHSMLKNVMCSFDESEKANLTKLKKGQQTTLVGKGDGSTGGLYVGLQNCKIQ